MESEGVSGLNAESAGCLEERREGGRGKGKEEGRGEGKGGGSGEKEEW